MEFWKISGGARNKKWECKSIWRRHCGDLFEENKNDELSHLGLCGIS